MVFPKRFNGYGEAHHKCGWLPPIAQHLGLNREGAWQMSTNIHQPLGLDYGYSVNRYLMLLHPCSPKS